MPTSEGLRVVTVPFPYVEQNQEKRRPALIVTTAEFGELYDLAWVVMITSARRERWPGDIVIDDLATAGLRAPSVIRPAKLTMVELAATHIIGSISLSLSESVRYAVATAIGIAQSEQ